MTGYDLHVTEQPSSQQIEPTSHTVIVQTLQDVGGPWSDVRTTLDQKTQPLLDDGYRVTHVTTCAVRSDLILTTVVLEREIIRREDNTGKRAILKSSVEMNHMRGIADAFIDERLEFTGDPDDVISTRKIYAEYLAWYDKTQPTREENHMNIMYFGRYLVERGAGQPRSALMVNGEKVRVRTGVRFK